ncbi:DNA alkylation repair protein [Flavimaricola marinus]|uniref:DNA alkylation repair enzyme n=1 Tax=Flavimaricola marinus TaxID=1819565 RepID=A0A238LDS8_9RHOB|nr:DNA alkylation repair protein [Flavimaricola marinus]SMY07771.1 DNA alkylation repair enzyme [Flavimaricola marinus]
MTPTETLAHLESIGNEGDAAGMLAYHKLPRRYLGVRAPVLSDLARDLRNSLSLDDRLALAKGLWESDVHDARMLAAKLLEQARIRPDDEGAWQLIQSWVPDFDGWALADHACIAGQKRLKADPSRIDAVEAWTTSDELWTRRAALVITLPWTKQNNPSAQDLEIRERVLGWAASYVPDREWFIQKAIAWWLRDLSKHDPDRTRAFLAAHGDKMKPFAVKEASRHLPDAPAAPVEDSAADENAPDENASDQSSPDES